MEGRKEVWMEVVLGRGDGAVVGGGMGSDGTIWAWIWI